MAKRKPVHCRRSPAAPGGYTQTQRTAETPFGCELRAAFLLNLVDCLGSLEDAYRIRQTAGRLLGEQLTTERVQFVEMLDDTDLELDPSGSEGGGEFAGAAGRYAMPDLGETASALRRGGTVAVADTETLPVLSAMARARYRALGIAAFVAVPLLRGGKLASILTVLCKTPRAWSPEEISLIEDVGARTWDAVERSRTMQSLRASAARFRLVNEAAGFLVVVIGPDGTILEWNREAERVFGFASGEVIGKNFLKLFLPPQERAGVAAGLQKVFAGVSTQGYESSVLAGDGARRWYLWNSTLLRDDDDRPMGALSVGRDITRRKEAEAALQQSEAQFRAAFEASAVGICQAEPAIGRLLGVNRRFCEMVGYSEEELLGRPFSEIIHPDDQAANLADYYRLARGEVSECRTEERFVHKDGSVIWVELTVNLVSDHGGPPKRTIAIVLDIAERKRLQQELLDISEREQRRLGHDLHDGLGQRLTGLEMLSHGLAADLETQAAHLANQAKRLNRELRETVTQARLISHSLAPVPLNGEGLMRGLAELAASTRQLPGVKCRFRCDPPVQVPDATEATHLYRIAQEAVNNALKHGKAKLVSIVLREREGVLELTVQNNGRTLPKVRRLSGGMGLNVMRYRAGMIGATLVVESCRRKGARVKCTLARRTK